MLKPEHKALAHAISQARRQTSDNEPADISEGIALQAVHRTARQVALTLYASDRLCNVNEFMDACGFGDWETEPLRCEGVWRDPVDGRLIYLAFNRPPRNSELLYVQKEVKRASERI